jgi:hypothetical protein
MRPEVSTVRKSAVHATSDPDQRSASVGYWPGPAGGSNIVHGSDCGRKAQGMLLYDGLGEPYVTVHDAHHPGRLADRDGVLADVYSLPEP